MTARDGDGIVRVRVRSTFFWLAEMEVLMIAGGTALMIELRRTSVTVVMVSIAFRVGVTKTDGHGAADTGRY